MDRYEKLLDGLRGLTGAWRERNDPPLLRAIPLQWAIRDGILFLDGVWIAPEDREDWCREYGLPEQILECILAWKHRRNGTDILDVLPKAWDVSAEELREWKQQINR